MKTYRYAIIAVFALVHVGPLAAQGGMIKVADGKLCKIAFGPRDTPPDPPLVAAACIVDRKDIRDPDGKIVSEIGFYAWTEGITTRVRVFLMVPAPGAPNRWLKEKGDDPKLLRPKPFTSFTLKPGESKRIEELKTLGIDPWTVRFEAGLR